MWILKSRPLQGRRRLDGLDISIENRPGSIRRWTDHDGTEGETRMRVPYGYARRTESPGDNEHQDVFLGPLATHDQVQGTTVYVVTTRKPPEFREVDEQKSMIGWSDEASARAAFLQHYDDERFISRINALPWEDWKCQALATGRFPQMIRGDIVHHAPDITKARLVLKAKREVLPSASPPVSPAGVAPPMGSRTDQPYNGPALSRSIGASLDEAQGQWVRLTSPGVTGRLVLKAHIRAFSRTVDGKTVEVPEHEDKRMAARPRIPHPRSRGARPTPTGRPAPATTPPRGRLRFAPPGVKHPPGVSPAKPPRTPEAPKPIEASAIPHKDLAKHLASFRPILHKTIKRLQAAFPGLPVAGRLKETSSLAEKLQRKGKGLEEIEDICGTRVTFGSIHEETQAVERLKRQFTVRSEDDYLTRPKEGMNYRSYHMILEIDGRPVELQLRTQRQTRWADYAHDSAYKTHGKTPPPDLMPYLKGMSDYFACRDGGGSTEKCGPLPPCPPLVAKTVSCLEAA